MASADELIDAFFTRHLENGPNLTGGAFPESDAEGSAFTDAKRSKLSLDDLRAIENHGPFGFLEAYWTENGLEALLPMIGDLEKLAGAIQAELSTGDDGGEDLPAFVYAMY